MAQYVLRQHTLILPHFSRFGRLMSEIFFGYTELRLTRQNKYSIHGLWKAIQTQRLRPRRNYRWYSFLPQLEEVYRIVKPVHDLIKFAQSTSIPVTPDRFQRLVLLTSETLEPSTPLKVHHIASYTSQKKDDVTEMCEPQNLSEVTRMTRRVSARLSQSAWLVNGTGVRRASIVI